MIKSTGRKVRRRTALRKADEWFSRYIRIRDADSNGMCPCITSGRMYHWKEIDCGHFRKRGKMATRYDERNCNAQSRSDNRFSGGKDFEYGQAIDDKYGDGTARELHELSQTERQMKTWELLEIAEEYKTKAKELAELKGIEI